MRAPRDGRRRRRTVVVALVVVVLVGGLAPAVTAGATSDDIRQSFTASLGDRGRVRTVADYRIPDRVRGLTVVLPAAATDAVRVTALRGFRRTNGSTFAWTGAARPRIELALSDDARRVLAGDGWALVVRPDVSVSYRYRGSQPGVDTSLDVAGRGYVDGPLAYVGSYRTRAVTAGGERTTFVVSAAAEPVDVSGAARFLRLAPDRFDLGVRRDAVTAFVLPERHDPTARVQVVGATVRSSLWVGPRAVRPDSTDVTFVHEYVHTRLGVVGEGSTRWLTEATAEYFGHAFALNAGIGDYRDFRRGLDPSRFGPATRSAVLSDPGTWAGTTANYGKGALVLAALDATIRRRTDGAHTLADVFVEHPGPYADHAAFRRAVVETTGVPSLGDWLDRYVTTDATPALPDDPSLYVYGPRLDPDDDGTPSGREVARETNPFVAGGTGTTARSSDTATATRTRTNASTPASTRTATPVGTGEGTAGTAGGFGAPVAATGVGLAALAGALAARRRE
ncbi:MAG: hypothetical protein ABEJ81_08535 [Haloferacaceae archaeon]